MQKKHSVFLNEEMGKHEYYVNGDIKESVSDILAFIDCKTLKFIPPRYLVEAGERGTRIHSATEDYEFERDKFDWNDFMGEEQENADIYNYIIAYANFIKEHPSIPVGIELSLYSEEFNICGTIDRLKHIGDKLAVVDIKSAKTIGTLRSQLQLFAYYKMARENGFKVEDAYILQLKDNGTYELMAIDIFEPEVEETFRWLVKLNSQIKNDKKLKMED